MPPLFSIDFNDPLLTLPLVGLIGYWVRSTWNYTRFSVMRESGHHLLYNSILFGFAIILVMILFYFPINYLLIFSPLTYSFATDLFVTYIITGVAIFFPYFVNSTFFSDKHKYIRRTMEIYGDSLYLTIFESYINKHFVELTLKNGKVFIGFSPNLLGFRYEYVDIIPYNGIHEVSIRAEEILTARQVDPQDFQQDKPSDD